MYHKINEFQNMKINILEHGEISGNRVWHKRALKQQLQQVIAKIDK